MGLTLFASYRLVSRLPVPPDYISKEQHVGYSLASGPKV